MRNVVLIKVDLDDSDKPLSDARLVATFTLTAAPTNTQAAAAHRRQGRGDPVAARRAVPL